MSKTTLTFGLAAVVLVLGILATSARGSTTGGGIITIDQSKIPFTINASGSYRLTSDLVETNQLVTPVTINVPGVTIDLNGFSISGGYVGIDGSKAYLVTIQNGEVSGARSGAIVTGHSSRISNVRAFGTAGTGMVCADGCVIDHCVVNNNAGAGIVVVDGSNNGRAVISSNVVQYNGEFGIFLGLGASLVTGNAINNNGGSSGEPGLAALTGSSCAYSNNVFDANGAPPVGCFNLGQNACTGAACP